MAGLCTLANVKVALFPTSYTDTTDDALIQLYIDAFTNEVQEYTGRQFIADAAPTTYYFDIPRPTRTLYIPQGIVSYTNVDWATGSQPASGGTYTTVTAANVLLRPLIGDRRQGFPADTIQISDIDPVAYFYPGYNTVRITAATLGFATVPADIERLSVAVIVRRWQARKGGQTDTIGASDFGGPVLRFMSAEEMATLSRYVDVAVG